MTKFTGNLAMGCDVGFSMRGDFSDWDVHDNAALNCGTGWDIAPTKAPIPKELIATIESTMKAGAPPEAVVQSFGKQLAKFGMDFEKVVKTAKSGVEIIKTLTEWASDIGDAL